MNTTLVRTTLAALCRIVLGSSIAIGLTSGPPAIAHGGGGGGGGGGHGGGGMGGGGHMGGGGFHGGGFGWGHGGHMGGGYYGRGGYGYGGYYPGFFGFGGLGLGYGLGYGYGYPGYGYGYGYPGYGLGYSDYGYGSYPGYSYGSGYYYPGYTYGTGYVDPGSSYLVNSYSNSGYVAAPSSGYTYSSAYGTVPLQATTPAAPSSFPLPSLGIDEQGVSDATGSHIQVTRVHPGSPAERAGLKVGDTIASANGYLTQKAGNLAWIINHHAPNGVVTLNIRKAANGQDATVNATLH